MNPNYFSSLLPELSTRAARSTIGVLGFSNPPLRRHLLEVFSTGYGRSGCFLGDPVFEATFGWKQADKSLEDLSGKLLNVDVVKAMNKPWGESGKDYEFPKTAKPYTHQLAAWETLLSPGYQSVVLTSGTGSGKTEAFMVPVLSRIADNRKKMPGQSGVQAVFLYPLNALIQSQRERLNAWTGPLNGDIRFCLYNGMTPEEAPIAKTRAAPHEVHDRTTLRQCPPEILVTNPTMLEYMLVRAQDAPILDRSQGQLEWIVLDEAHNYIGSQAAELALLLRRVLHAFGTSAEKVHFVATSATIGSRDEESRKQLQNFLARLAGVSPERVKVIAGERHIPEVTARVDPKASGIKLEELRAGAEDPEGSYKRLSAHPMARKLRSLFVSAERNSNYQPLKRIRSVIGARDDQSGDMEALQWLDLLSGAYMGEGRSAMPFLPLRMHAFHNTINGIWACANPACDVKRGTKLDDPDWPFGMVYMDDLRRCACGSPVFPLVSCNDCNETFLSADLVTHGGILKLTHPVVEDVDEFTLDRDPEEMATANRKAEVEDEDDPEALELNFTADRTSVLVVNGNWRGAPLVIDTATGVVVKDAAENTVALRIQDIAFENGTEVMKCPVCDGAENKWPQFRKAILGAPFQLGNIIPTLLEFCPDGEVPLDRPRRGRRMITFTDSRQGTARIAAKLQQDAERNALRASVYKKLVSQAAGSSGERDKLTSEIEQLTQHMPADGPLRDYLLGQLKEKKAQLSQLSNGKPVPYNDMVAWLSSQASDIKRWIYNSYKESDATFNSDKGRDDLVRILICREFGRRPKRQNSLETMGLVSLQYPKLMNIVNRRPAVEIAGFTIEEWRDFLKITIDFFVRQSWAIHLPSNWSRWGGQKVGAKEIQGPTAADTSKRLLKWPKVQPGKVQGRLVRLLAYVLKVDPTSEHGKDRIDSLLLAAWDDLATTSGLLQQGGQGRYLDLADASFQNITKAWVCPVTRRVLDVTLRNVTPYLPAKQLHEGVALCRPIEIPVCDVIAQDFPSDDLRIEAVRRWVDTHPSLEAARIEGIWSDINERIIEGAGYFRSVEHSAQQTGSRLEEYERQFREGLINVMSCSTTMEMGVDIGGINMVAMNNVPPHPANYLQRAGRAGRRGETRSVALTVCKNNPHDQHVFNNTTWPFVTRIRTPGISLDSPLLVQRHINSMLLAKFLRTQSKDGKLMNLTLEWWMLPRGDSRQERFCAWCECYKPEKHDDLERGVSDLIRRTVFEGRNIQSLVAETGKAVAEHAREWMQEYEAITSQIAQLVKRDESDKVPMKALEIQMSRMKGEYLLREMATSGVLPGYGFPTDITTFETLNKDSLEIQKNRNKTHPGREDNRFQRRELPSRDTVTALREYAPGASVVIDGLVYESAGITLNWHAPATLTAVNELQNIRQAWRCGHCGASGTFVVAQHVESCPDCGTSLIDSGYVPKQYLEPAGFSVDLFSETHNDITLQEYVPVEPPWITAHATWMPLINPALGRFRATPSGSVFHYSSGRYGSGYALCLECGRAAPMGNEGDPHLGLPKIFQRPHKRLRGRQGGSDSICGGSDGEFKIKKGINFGREYTTDVLEVTLFDLEGKPLVDSKVAYTVAVALRRAIAVSLGIDEAELGCESKPIRDEFGRKIRVIQIFDIRSAGYSGLAASELPSLLRDVRSNLECEAHCEGACQACLLSFDTRFRADDLDRQAALKFISKEWIDSLALSPADQLLGALSRAEYQPVDEAITRELHRGDARKLYIYLHGDPLDWDLPGSGLRRFLHRLSVYKDVELFLVTAQTKLDLLSRDNASILDSLRNLGDVRIRHGKSPVASGESKCIATLERANGISISWATNDLDCVSPTSTWGRLSMGLLVSAQTLPPHVAPGEISLPDWASGDAKKVQVFAVDHQLDGQGHGFGRRFWSHFDHDRGHSALPSDKTVVSISYEDRYLATPLACALLLEAVCAIKNFYEPLDGWGDVSIKIMTGMVDETKVPRLRNNWLSNWESSHSRKEALEAAFNYSGMTAEVLAFDKRDLIHGRRLSIRFQDGRTLVLWLDQGWSYWGLKRGLSRTNAAHFYMHGPAAEVGEQLANIRVAVEGYDLPTQIFLDRQNLK